MIPIDDDLLARYVAGECSQEEVASVLQWAGTDAEREARIARARALSDAVESLDARWDVDRAWARAQSVMRSTEPETRLNQAAPSLDDPDLDLEPVAVFPGPRVRWRATTRPTRTPAFAAAACLVLVAGIAAWRVLDARHAFTSSPESIVTGPRQRVSVQLRDGSHVILGPESHLVETAQFGTGTREVTLEGAAYFDVVHDPARPFVVIARNLRIRDLGTRFAVDAYAKNPSVPNSSNGTFTRVAVAAGSVALEPVGRDTMRRAPSTEAGPATAASIVLGAGSVGRMDPDGRISVDRPTNLSQYVSWTSGTLTLDDVPLSEAVGRLEHWYGVTIELADPALACRHITAAFHDEPLTDALDELGLALHLRHIESGGSVMLADLDDRLDDHAHSDRQAVGLDACGARTPSPAAQRE